MRKLAGFIIILLLGTVGCALQQPDVIVITATFPPPQSPQPGVILPTQPTSVLPPTLQPTLPPLATLPPEGTLIDPTPNQERPAESTAPLGDYVVQPGDTVYGIAAENGVSMDTLLAINDVPNPDNLYVGQVLHLPDPPSTEGSDFKIVPDSRLVRAPGSSTFDVTAFVNSQPGYLRFATDTVDDVVFTGAQVVQRVALEYSVDPRLLLVLLEYKSHLLSNPNPTDDEKNLALGAPAYASGILRDGLYRQLAYGADQLNSGYYGWKLRGLNQVEFTDQTRILFARDLNPGTVGVQYFLSLGSDYPTWQHAVSRDGLYRTYVAYFGDPFLGAVEPLIPPDLQQPTLVFPFPQGQMWYYTGGPHGGYGEGSAWSAIDFAPPDDITQVTSACYVSDNFGTAVGAGVIARTAEGTVILDLDGDGDESTGWTILYLHIAAQDRVKQGTVVEAGDRIGRPSCEGGVSNGTHMHIARRYNGEWIPVTCDDCIPDYNPPPLVLSGWTVYGVPGQEYQGGMLKRGAAERLAEQGRNITENQVQW